jgi:D-3-phosphoglycerate dehydrogenase
VGLGKIPQALVPKAQAFGIDVIAFDPYISDEVATSIGVERVELEGLLGRSDYVSLHAPLTPETENLLNADTFAKMKPGVLVVNTARGPMVDPKALLEALEKGQVGGAALDVVPTEPLPADSALLGHDNLILTPHSGFYSEEALLELQTKAAKDVASVLSGETPRYPLNPQVLKSS